MTVRIGGGAAFPNAPADIANVTANLVAAQTINLNQAITVGSLVVGDSTTPFFAFTVAPNGGSLTLDNSALGASISTSNVATGVFNVISAPITLNDALSATTQNTNSLTISGNIGETGGARALTKLGSTTSLLTLSGGNSYSGGTTITGNLNAGNNTALGGSPVTISNGAGNQLQLGSGVNVATVLTRNGGGVTAQGALYVPTGNATYSGTVNYTTVTNAGGVFATGGGTLTIAGNNTITSAVLPVTVRAGVVVYSGSQNYTAGTTLANTTAAIQFAQVSSMPATGTVTLSTGTTLAANVGGARQGTLLLSGGTHTVNGEAVVGGTFGRSNGSAELDARLQMMLAHLPSPAFSLRAGAMASVRCLRTW